MSASEAKSPALESGRAPETPSSTIPTARQRRAFVPVHPTPCGKYTLIAKIGHGGMAEVFLAMASGMAGFRKIAVVKRIHPQLLEEPEFVQMFMDEARLAARLSHPNVVQTHEVGEHDGVPFMAMEYMEGQPYDKMIKALKRAGIEVPVKLAVRVAMEALAGLHYAHELKDFDGSQLGVVHRDVSPSNMFITYQGVVKILDFGIAKATTKLSETRTGQIKGKLSYMAPEQARGLEVDARADIWSMGVTLFETCTGTRLFRGESDVDTLQRVLSGDIARILEESSRGGFPEPLMQVVRKALARRTEDRFASAEDMRRALEEVLPQLEGPDPRFADFLSQHFQEVADAQREMLGDLLEQAEQLQAQAEQDAATLAQARASVPPEPAPATDDRQRSRALFMVLLVLAAIVGGGAIAMMTMQGEGGDDPALAAMDPGDAPTSAEAVDARETGAGDAPGSEVGGGQAEGRAAEDERGSTVDAPAGDEAADDTSGDGEGADDTSADDTSADDTSADDTSADDTSADEAPPEETRADDARARAAAARRAAAIRARRERARRARQARRGSSSSETPSETSSDSSSSAAREFGNLRLVTRPWSEVFLGGRSLGVTPLLNERLPAGTHTLVLRNGDEGIEQRARVTIRPGETTTMNIGLR